MMVRERSPDHIEGKAKGVQERKSQDATADGGPAIKRFRTPEEQRAEIERVAKEHGADLSEEGFNEALRKVGKHKP